MPDVHVQIEDRDEGGTIARVTIDYQEKLNAVTGQIIEKLREEVEGLHEDENLRVMILTGAGERAFIGGVDINEMAALHRGNAEEFINRIHLACDAIRRLPVPVIARISGYCFGGGLEIAASCDLRVATKGSKLGMPEVNMGLPSVIEAALLPGLVGWGKARELVITGLPISAEEAFRCGLVEKVVAPEQLDQAVEEWVQAIVKAGRRAVRLQKALLQDWERLPVREAIQRGIQSFGQAFDTDEPRTLMNRFLSRKRAEKVRRT
jgi:enoyl-CoA hydratase/carnithine racemase